MQEREVLGGPLLNQRCLLIIILSKRTSHVTINFERLQSSVVKCGVVGPHSDDLDFGPRSMQENSLLLIIYNRAYHATRFCLQVLAQGGI